MIIGDLESASSEIVASWLMTTDSIRIDQPLCANIDKDAFFSGFEFQWPALEGSPVYGPGGAWL
jgi:hypothetical protein